MNADERRWNRIVLFDQRLSVFIGGLIILFD